MKDKPIPKPEFTTSMDTGTLTPAQEQQLEEMAQFLQNELNKK